MTLSTRNLTLQAHQMTTGDVFDIGAETIHVQRIDRVRPGHVRIVGMVGVGLLGMNDPDKYDASLTAAVTLPATTEINVSRTYDEEADAEARRDYRQTRCHYCAQHVDPDEQNWIGALLACDVCYATVPTDEDDDPECRCGDPLCPRCVTRPGVGPEVPTWRGAAL